MIWLAPRRLLDPAALAASQDPYCYRRSKFAFAGGRPNCLLGTGALPLETPTENTRLIKSYLAR